MNKHARYHWHHSLADSRCCLLIPGEDYFRPERLEPDNRKDLLAYRKATVVYVKSVLDRMRSQ